MLAAGLDSRPSLLCQIFRCFLGLANLEGCGNASTHTIWLPEYYDSDKANQKPQNPKPCVVARLLGR